MLPRQQKRMVSPPSPETARRSKLLSVALSQAEREQLQRPVFGPGWNQGAAVDLERLWPYSLCPGPPPPQPQPKDSAPNPGAGTSLHLVPSVWRRGEGPRGPMLLLGSCSRPDDRRGTRTGAVDALEGANTLFLTPQSQI